MRRYNPKDIEPKWQKTWDEQGIYEADLTSSKPKYIAMSMFNYPSGAGIHIGHAMNYTISDVKARFMRQLGHESYHPVGWDAFGLPAENYAIKAGVSPQESMAKIIPSYHKQYKAMGWSNDWTKEISTHEPEYYRWTQWIFLQMLESGLAYQDTREQWWCEKCQTVLANEQVIDGKCWRHDSADDQEVQKKQVKQWFFKITDYAEELLDAIDGLDWTDSVKLAQKNWIGKSKGAQIKFQVAGKKDHEIEVFTTRPDTLFGATFLVLAPEHPMVNKLTIESERTKIEEYVKKAIQKSEVERQVNKDKTGVFTGAYAINPANSEKIPIWIADYVLPGYGTGAIMAVPAHDDRDHEFADKFNIPVTEVVSPYINLTGPNAARENTETLERTVVDAIIKNQKGEYLLLIEKDNTHFVGGGVDEEDAGDLMAAIKREVAEESGYTDIGEIKEVSSTITVFGYRIPKLKNQYTVGKFYEVTLNSDKQTKSEVDEGLHSIKWVPKEEVRELLTWDAHAFAWEQYMGESNCFSGEGLIINSGEYNDMSSADMREKIVADLAKQGIATEKINYKMRDWSVSRQRYWGAPIPIINCPKCGPQAVPEKDLPVELPILKDFQPSGDGRSALARATDWLKVSCPNCGGDAERETDTLDTYIDSSWYSYRYFDPKNQDRIFDPQIIKKWEPIDFYNGGDHATAHLLYARFIGHFFKKLGLVDEPEPFKQFLFNGKVTATDGTKFSKSKGNGVDPLEIIGQGYGADALRTYLMFASPLEQTTAWDPQGIPGAFRFISRVWNLVDEYQDTKEGKLDAKIQADLLRSTHKMIKKVTQDLESNDYNTAIAAMMACTNEFFKLKELELCKCADWQFALESLVACMAPFAPHAAEELWQTLGGTTTVHKDSWPKWDDKFIQTDNITIVVQVNGKVRANIEMPAGSTEEQITEAAEKDAKVTEHTKPGITKTVFVPGKLVNFVVKN